MPPLSLRTTISALAATSIAVVAVITLTITISTSIGALRSIGKSHASVLLDGAAQKTLALFDGPLTITAEWGSEVPLWAMGCIVYELATGARLFDGAATDDGLEHLHMIQKVLGAPLPPGWGVRHSRKKEKARFFDDASTSGDLRPLTDAKSVGRVASAPTLAQAIQDDDLRDLIVGLLQVDPKRRLGPRQMAAHAFVRKHYPESESSQPLFFISHRQRAGDPSPPTAPQKEEPSH